MILKSEIWFSVERMDFKYVRIVDDFSNKILNKLDLIKYKDIIDIKRFFKICDSKTNKEKNYLEEGESYLLFDSVDFEKILNDIKEENSDIYFPKQIIDIFLNNIKKYNRKIKIQNILESE